jgi:chromosomal replication initiation ATPase DnaA
LTEACYHLNELVSARRQVVVTSTRPDHLQLLAGSLLDDRQPLIAEIHYPDSASRMLIARRATAAIGATLSARVLRTVA